MYHRGISGKTCPTTRPSHLVVDNTTAIYGRDYNEYTALLLNIDCKNDLGFGAGVRNAMSDYHVITDLLENGTENLYVREGF